VPKFFVAIKYATHSHFQSLYINEEEANVDSISTMLQNIPMLIFPEEEIEIINSIWGLDLDTVTVLDGFSIHFY